MMSNTREKFIDLVSTIILILILGFLYKWIWNETMPYLFGLPTITYWKMIGLSVLSKALFGNSVRLKK